MSFAKINKEIFNEENIKWFDKVGILPIDNERNAEIKLSYFGYVDHYSGYEIKIINKKSGQISFHEFKFADYLDHNDRIDRRPDWNGDFHIWANGPKLDWYIAKPSQFNIKRLTSAIMEYINLYR